MVQYNFFLYTCIAHLGRHKLTVLSDPIGRLIICIFIWSALLQVHSYSGLHGIHLILLYPTKVYADRQVIQVSLEVIEDQDEYAVDAVCPKAAVWMIAIRSGC